jgi:hypothetical protein
MPCRATPSSAASGESAPALSPCHVRGMRDTSRSSDRRHQPTSSRSRQCRRRARETRPVALAERRHLPDRRRHGRLAALCDGPKDFEDFRRFRHGWLRGCDTLDVMRLHCNSSRGAVPDRHQVVRNWDLSADAVTGLRFGRKNFPSKFAPCRSRHLTRVSPMKRQVHRS